MGVRFRPALPKPLPLDFQRPIAILLGQVLVSRVTGKVNPAKEALPFEFRETARDNLHQNH